MYFFRFAFSLLTLNFFVYNSLYNKCFNKATFQITLYIG